MASHVSLPGHYATLHLPRSPFTPESLFLAFQCERLALNISDFSSEILALKRGAVCLSIYSCPSFSLFVMRGRADRYWCR